MAGRDAGSDLERTDRIFEALAHPVRRQILLVIRFRGGRMASGEIAERFSCRWATTSHHLAALRKAGLVLVRRRGRRRFYVLSPKKLLRSLKEFATLFARGPTRARTARGKRGSR